MENQEPKNNLQRVVRVVKKAYIGPCLKEYGAIHLVTQASGGGGSDAAAVMTMVSDRNAKENIVKIGTHPFGIGLYLFDYKAQYRDTCGDGRQFGVMADEVETVMPEAVSIHANGYKQVNYTMLGINTSIH